jgi:hypothetical protein
MLRKIAVVLCLLLFAGASLGGQQCVFAKEEVKAKQDNQKKSFKEKYAQKMKAIKNKIRKKMERRTPSAVTSVRG